MAMLPSSSQLCRKIHFFLSRRDTQPLDTLLGYGRRIVPLVSDLKHISNSLASIILSLRRFFSAILSLYFKPSMRRVAWSILVKTKFDTTNKTTALKAINTKIRMRFLEEWRSLPFPDKGCLGCSCRIVVVFRMAWWESDLHKEHMFECFDETKRFNVNGSFCQGWMVWLPQGVSPTHLITYLARAMHHCCFYRYKHW